MSITYGDKCEYLETLINIKNKRITIDMTAHFDEPLDFFMNNIDGKVSLLTNKNIININLKSKPLDC